MAILPRAAIARRSGPRALSGVAANLGWGRTLRCMSWRASPSTWRSTSSAVLQRVRRNRRSVTTSRTAVAPLAPRAVRELAPGVATAVAGMAGIGPLSASVIVGALRVAWQADREDEALRWRRRGLVAAVAADRVGGDIELERLATADDIRRELTARVLRSAERAPVEDKLRALSTVLAEGLDGSRPLDEAFVLAAALDVLEGAHVELLNIFCHGQAPVQRDDGSQWWRADELAERFPHLQPVLLPCLQTLLLHGLIQDQPRGDWVDTGASRQSATSLGELCLTLFQVPPDAS